VKRRQLLQGVAGAAALAAVPASVIARAATPDRVVRWSFPIAETGFDPVQVSDLYSNIVIAHIIEPPLQYDFLARPAQLRPRTAAAMPDVSADFRVYTVRLAPGIFFQDHPAFKGKRRELVAADCVYAFKRVYDPRWKSPHYQTVQNYAPLELEDLRKQAQAGGRFDYDREVAGVRVLDRYVFEVRLARPDPRFIYALTIANYFGAVAREVVESASTENELMGQPVGTGPFRLAQWRRGSLIALERNPGFREEVYAASPPLDDARSVAIAERMRGKRLPLLDRVEISIIQETQPQWLAFLNGQLDVGAPGELLNTAAPLGRLSPSLARQGIWLERMVNPDVVATYFNMEDPLLGGLGAPQTALRRAISLGYNIEQEIRDLRRGQMLPAQSPIPPGNYGFEPDFVSAMSEFSKARARALLDTYGYVDRDGDGWREQPDGKPLVLLQATGGDGFSRASNEIWKTSMDAIGLKMEFQIGQWPEQLKSARAGKLMMWGLGWSATVPDGETFLDLCYGPLAGSGNLARFKLPEYDRLHQQQRVLGNSPERLAVMREMKRLIAVYMPYRFHGHRIVNNFVHPWVIGYRRHPFARDAFKWIDIDVDQRAAAGAG
jgi:ABC-type transport system substrate-binding protein